MKQKHVKQTEDEAKAKQAKHAEDEAKMKHSEDEAKQNEAEDEVAGDPAHADEEQDIELIKKMIAEYLGEEEMGEAETETYHELAKEAYESYKEMGYSEDEAKQAAGHALKLAKHMAAKQGDQKQEEACEDEAKQNESEDEVKQTESKEEESETKESLKTRITKLEEKLLEARGALAAMKLTLNKSEVEKYVETKLKESKRPVAITKAFRESAGKIVSKSDFDTKWAVFCEGIKNSRAAVDFGALFTEKAPVKEDGSTAGKTLDFSNCAE